MPRPLRVFLCHASQDKPAVWNLYRYLKQRGVKPWLDQEDLLPGENWEVEIPNALFSSDVILVCLSKNSVDKEGYVQKEISFALDKALEKPEGTIFIIPVKLEDCELPKRLSRYQWVGLSRADGRKRLLMGLNKRVKELGDEVTPVILEDTRRRKPVLPDQTEREFSERIAREKTEREAAGKAAHDAAQAARRQMEQQAETEGLAQAAKEKTAREKLEREAVEKAAREKAKRAAPKQEEPNVSRISTSYSKSNPTFPRAFGIGGVAIAALLFIILGGNYIVKNIPTVTKTPILTSSATLKPPTPTKTPSTATPVFTPAPGIGSTMISEKDDMVLAYVPAGEFTMGSDTGDSDEKPVHPVNLDAFWMDQTEVTNAMYEECVNANQCDPPWRTSSYTRDSYYGNSEFDNYPVLYVNWNQAKTYCEWADRRLPTEAEWEKAARGAEAFIYPWGNDAPNSGLLNYNQNIGDTTEVGKYPDGASIYGALDMSGNVWEWVNDWYDSAYYASSPESNPTGPNLLDGQYRVLRGGSWYNNSYLVRSSNRVRLDPTGSYVFVGFRCSRSP